MFRAFDHARIDLRHLAMVGDLTTDLPLMGFCLLMGCTRIADPGSYPVTVSLRKSTV